ncbi:hypothetical protein BB558_003210 [Smittium angustum]|uniref:Ankyrin repeat protein n=1 Tax=Smittium angustum TaxID=133377 RepID=A0A2U1J6M1_SMIAN|nr:hypothetical protein BB558_003210 [Smittium angustum]
MGFEQLDFLTTSKIFIECQRPELSTLSRSFYEVSHSTSVQAKFLIKEFGINRVYGKFGFQRVYRKLSQKENVYLALIKRKVSPFNYPYSMFGDCLERGWLKLLEKLLTLNKLQLVSEPNNISSKIYTVVPIVDINRISRYIGYIARKGHIEILRALDYAHKIKIDITREYGIPKEQILGGESLVQLHPKFHMVDYVGGLLFTALVKKQHEFAEYVLAISSDVGLSDYIKCFQYSVKYGDTKATNLLKKHKSLETLFTSETLEISIENGDLELAQKHIAAGIPLQNINYLAIKTASNGNMNTLQFLLDNGANPAHNSFQSVVSASANGKIEAVKLLVKRVGTGNIGKNKQLSRALSQASSNGHLDVVKYLVEIGADPTYMRYDPNGCDIHIDDDFALQQACYSNYEIAKYLVENGANINANNYASLSNAIFYNKVEIVKLLLENTKNRYNNFKVHVGLERQFEAACLNDQIETVKLLLEFDNQVHSNLTRVMILAYKNQNYSIVKLLIENGADLNTEDSYILCDSICNNNLNLIEFLLEKDAQVGTKTNEMFLEGCRNGIQIVAQKLLNMETVHQNTDLIKEGFIKAIMNKHGKIVSMIFPFILEMKNIDQKLVISCCKYGNVFIAEKLIGHRPDIEMNWSKCLLLGCRSGDLRMVKLAIENGAKVSAKEDEALRVAYMSNYSEIVDLLLLEGASPKMVPSFELLIACRKGDILRAKELINEGKADIKFQNYSCLVWASINDHSEVTELLLRNGADVNAQKGRGLIVACRKGNYEIVKLFIDYGADVMIRNNRPLVCAISKNNIVVAKLLLASGAQVTAKKGHAIYWTAKSGGLKAFNLIFGRYNDAIAGTRDGNDGNNVRNLGGGGYYEKSLVWTVCGRNNRVLNELRWDFVDEDSVYFDISMRLAKRVGWDEGRGILKRM